MVNNTQFREFCGMKPISVTINARKEIAKVTREIAQNSRGLSTNKSKNMGVKMQEIQRRSKGRRPLPRL